MIFSINDVVKNTSSAYQGKNFTVLSINIYQAQTTMKMYYGHALFCETYIRYFSMIPPIFFFSFFLLPFAIHKHLNFTVWLLFGTVVVLCVRMFCVTSKSGKRRDACCRWKITCYQQINILCLEYNSNARHIDGRLGVFVRPSLECFLPCAFYLLVYKKPHIHSQKSFIINGIS